MQTSLSFFQRLALAFIAFFAVLFNRQFAGGVYQLREDGKAGLPPRSEPETTTRSPAAEPGPALQKHAGALHLLAILQRDGRLVDFLKEDLGGFSDAEIGGAARAVHIGCRKVLESYVALEPVYRQPEGAAITVESGFDPARIRLSGNVVGNPPFRGSLRHHGWVATEVKLPNLPDGLDARVVAPAEVELE